MLARGVHLRRRLTGRAAHGAAATVVMSLPMLARWAVRPEPPPPMVVAENLQRAFGLKPERYPRALRHAIWSGAHLAFGAGIGAASLLWPRRARTSLAAQTYGAAVWSMNYGLALPALGLYPWPARDNRLRAAESLLSHAVYAAALRRLVRT